MREKDYCIRRAFAAVGNTGVRLAAGTITKSEPCNCSFCQRRKRLQTERELKERLEAIDREAKQNRRIREQRENEYEKTVIC